MKRWAWVLLATVSLSGCTQERIEKGWSGGWAIVQAPVLLACSPYNLLWDGVIWQDRALKDGLTRSMWAQWREYATGRDSAWAAPALLLLYPLVTITQPLMGILHLLAGIPVG